MTKIVTSRLWAVMGFVAAVSLGMAMLASLPVRADEIMAEAGKGDENKGGENKGGENKGNENKTAAGKPSANVVGEASSPSRKVPIRVKFVDYQKADDGPGTLKLSGTAIIGSDVHVYVDDKRFAKVPVSDADGTWSVEDKIPLNEAVHSVRVEQFDKKTNVVAGRAMFNMSLRPPSARDLATPRPSAR